MTFAPRPRRSLLFVPAANPRALEKSTSLVADGLIYDLEDSAVPEEKDAARERLRDHLAESCFPGERIVRINPLDSRYGTEDFLMARGAGVDAMLVPKVETVAGLKQVADALAETDAPTSMRLWAMIETPRGILDVDALAAAAASCRLDALVVGPNDIALSTGVEPGPDRAELLPWLMRIVLAAKAHGLATLDGVYADFRDAAGFAAECAAGRRMGFDGKTLIHPAQVDAANAAFGPSPEAVARAERVVAAFADPANEGRGVIQIDGRMVERLHLEQARQLLAVQAAIAAVEHRHTERMPRP
ncbi:MAG: CoA ester lyase [Aurantimonas endophytica]|uniref:Citrate lyase subunit beta/citryl-CoA lyase n=1 Tax=Aurantimonas endophytica TaxID=1522175 RepID=A0A7W6HEQ5_9HYPH|nr:CoA ester lyase [Aurantimonas endophytica]MBB4003833.1 citrate lyase subunit beta/citryl-CoA lyase [Aurantimonas endophytica]MCO6404686.1 CoA ester lyase [Aurantimonas endophytica]